MVKAFKWVAAVLLALVGSIMLGATLTNPAYGIGVFALAGFLVTPPERVKVMVSVLALVPAALLGLRQMNFDLEIVDADPTALEAGQYTAKSDDIAKLVTARVVIREGGHLIFAEAHSAPGVGLDHATLYREPHRALFYQGIPPAPAPESDPVTAQVVYHALSKALSGHVPRQKPQLPDGATGWGDGDTYWGMFPSEFDHRCTLADAADGIWEGQSSNPNFPARVRVTIALGKLSNIEVLQKWHSDYGKAAFEKMPALMIEKNEINLDAISGATRSSLIIRSAVWHACQAALKAKAVKTTENTPQ